MSEPWVTEIRDQCLTHRVPFFFKQWGGVRKKQTGRMLHGWTWDEQATRVALPMVSARGEADD
ncbi:DUF5131 family protein [Anaerolineales bacterium HSG25]|nr:DUF5131 family protein [Anaerolineales bacterium HSG25]